MAGTRTETQVTERRSRGILVRATDCRERDRSLHVQFQSKFTTSALSDKCSTPIIQCLLRTAQRNPHAEGSNTETRKKRRHVDHPSPRLPLPHFSLAVKTSKPRQKHRPLTPYRTETSGLHHSTVVWCLTDTMVSHSNQASADLPGRPIQTQPSLEHADRPAMNYDWACSDSASE